MWIIATKRRKGALFPASLMHLQPHRYAIILNLILIASIFVLFFLLNVIITVFAPSEIYEEGIHHAKGNRNNFYSLKGSK